MRFGLGLGNGLGLRNQLAFGGSSGIPFKSDIALTWSNISTDDVVVLFDNKTSLSQSNLVGGVFLDAGGYTRNATPSLTPTFSANKNGVVNGAMVTDATHFLSLGTSQWITDKSFCIRIKYYHDSLSADKNLFTSYKTSNTEYIRFRVRTTGLIEFQTKKASVVSINLTCKDLAINKVAVGWNDVIICVDKINLTAKIYLNGLPLSLAFNTVTNSDISLSGSDYGVMRATAGVGQIGIIEQVEIYDNIISDSAAWNIFTGNQNPEHFNNSGGKLQVTKSDYATASADTKLNPFNKHIYSDIRDFQYTFDEFYALLKGNQYIFATPVKDEKIQYSAYKDITTYISSKNASGRNKINKYLKAFPKKWGVLRSGDELKITGEYGNSGNLYLSFGRGGILNDTAVIWYGTIIPKLENNNLRVDRYKLDTFGAPYDINVIPTSKIVSRQYEYVGPVGLTDGVNSYWAGGHHGNDVTGYKSSRTTSVSYKLDGVEIVDGANYEGNVLELVVNSDIQNPFTQTGDYIGVVRLREVVTYTFKGGNINIKTQLYGITNEGDNPLTMTRYYGLQHNHDFFASELPYAVGQNTKSYIANSDDTSIVDTIYVNDGSQTIESGAYSAYPNVDKNIISNPALTIQSALWLDNTYGALKAEDRLNWIPDTNNQIFIQSRNDGWKSYVWSIKKNIPVTDSLYFTVRGGVNLFSQLKDVNGNALNAKWAYLQHEVDGTYLCVDYLSATTDSIKIPDDVIVNSVDISCPQGTITVNSIVDNVISITSTGYGSAKIKVT